MATTLLRYQSPGFEPRTRIAGFDMDWTLIRTKSGRVFPTSPDDWTLFHDHVAPRVQALYAEGYAICVFTNQEGVSKGRVTAEALVHKFAAVGEALGVPVLCQAATHNDGFRKPRVGMWTRLETEWQAEHGVVVDRAASLYVGDAAGRPSSGGPKRKGKNKSDFHDADYKFALNLGVGHFAVPEECFATGQPVPDRSTWRLHAPTAFVPAALTVEADDTRADAAPTIDPTTAALWLCVGPPAAGKSTFCATHAPAVARINQDTLKTRARCIKEARTVLAKGAPCIVDGTHRDAAARAHYVQVAEAAQVPCYCLWFDRTKEEAMHLNALRGLTGGARVPAVALHTYFKRAESPQAAEGFAGVERVPWCATFASEAARALAGQYLV
jgi:bifunctional polynucleotide phosphatase/kinase